MTVPAVRGVAKRVLAARYDHGGVVRAGIYCLLSPQFARLGGNWGDRLRIVLSTFSMALAELRSDAPVRPRRIPVTYAGQRYELSVGGCNDLDVLKSLLLDEAYEELPLPGEPELIVDLGSHLGASLLVFHARHPRARLVGVEPDPAVFERLRENAAGLDATLLNVAVAGRDGTVPFYAWRDTWGSSMFPTERARKSIEVPALTLESLLARANAGRVGLLKLNIEGAEFDVLTGFHGWDWVDAIIVEWHGDYLSPQALEEVSALLRGHFELEVEPVASRPGDYVITGVSSSPPPGSS
jgi:FkbM family methyltransferase